MKIVQTRSLAGRSKFHTDFLAALSKFGQFPSKKLHRRPFMHHNNSSRRAKGFEFAGKGDITSFQKPTHFQPSANDSIVMKLAVKRLNVQTPVKFMSLTVECRFSMCTWLIGTQAHWHRSHHWHDPRSHQSTLDHFNLPALRTGTRNA